MTFSFFDAKNNHHFFRAFKSILILICAVLLTSCSFFNQTAEDARQPAILKEFTPQIQVKTLWSSSTGDHAEGLGLGLKPVVRDGVLYMAGHNGVVTALNAENGRSIWSKATGASLSGGPGVGSGQVVVASSKGDVIALNVENGNENWRTKITGEVLSTPDVSAEQVAVRSANGTLNVLNANNGASLWLNEQEVPRLSLRGSSTPIITSGVVLSASDAGKVSSYDALDGAVLWDRLLGIPRGTTELDRLVDIDGNMQLNETSLFVVGYNSRLAKIDARNGSILWAKDHSSSTGVNLDWKNVYISNSDSHVVALEQANGNQVWKNEEYQYRELSAPVSTGTTVIVGDLEGFVHFLSAEDGSTIARQKISKSPIRAPGVYADNIVYMQSDDGTLVAFELSGP